MVKLREAKVKRPVGRPRKMPEETRIRIQIDASAVETLDKNSDYVDDMKLYMKISDALNLAGLDNELICRDGEYEIEIDGQPIGIFQSGGTPEDAITEAYRNLAEGISEQTRYDAWTSYRKGIWYFNVVSPKDEPVQEV